MHATARPPTVLRSGQPLRLGFASLCDAAPLVAAHELGLFAQRGLRVDLRREVGWATVRDKVIYGELEAAQAPAPMLWAAQLGLGGARADVLTALVLNLHGNALTLSTRLRDAGVQDAATFRTEALSRRGERRLTLGVVFPYSSHHLLLRHWLKAAGVNPERDVRIVVVPPAQMFRNLAAGTLDGYCVGEPWNTVAVRTGEGWCPAWSARLTPGHLEKVLLVRADFARERAAEHLALVATLHEACAWCDVPANREPLARWLAAPRYLDVPVEALLPSLTGRFDAGHGPTERVPDFHIFSRGGANRPAPEAAAALQTDLVAAGLVPRDAATADLPKKLFRDDLHRAALALGPAYATADATPALAPTRAASCADSPGAT